MNNKITVFIDSCAWNLLFEHKINLAEEFPFDHIELAMTKEVQSFEIDAIPETKIELKAFILEQIKIANIREDSFFGFSSYDDPPDHKYRVGGFDEGRFASIEELALIEKFQFSKTKLMGSALYKDEGDASLAVRAASGSIVLTAENPMKSGPLREATLEGGKIINIQDFNADQESFRDFVFKFLV
jgi:hypothetical protein